MADDRVKPELPGGFNDYGTAEMVARQRMLDTIRRSFERYGFEPLDTPCVEFEEVLIGKSGETEKQVFRLRSASAPQGGAAPTDGGGGSTGDTKPLALRFDLTVPLSRFVAAHGDLTFPFKRYQLGDVFRGERPQAGRYRQFKQFDADIVGARSTLADAEIVAVMHATLRDLGVARFGIRVNNRKVLNGLMNRLFGERAAALSPDEHARLLVLFMRILDKRDSIGHEGVLAELARAPKDPFDEALGLTPEQVRTVDGFLGVAGDNDAVVAALAEMVGADPQGAEGVAELRELLAHLAALGLAEADVRVDPSIARGLDYYTGIVMETTLHDAPSLGSVMSGGRYDGLVARFSASPIPAVGASIGVDRLFTAMKTLGLVPESATTTDVLVTVMEPEHLADYLGIAAGLRAAGWNTDLYYGANTSFKAQLRYALRKGVRFLVIRGGDERAAGTVQLKDLLSRRQEQVALAEAAAHLRRWQDEG